MRCMEEAVSKQIPSGLFRDEAHLPEYRRENEMNELIHVHLDTGQPLVLARDLHKGLEIQTKYATWMERMAEYGFVEGRDFFPFLGKSSGGRRCREHYLTIDTAKHICMIQRNEKGMKYRQYFLELEKAWNSPEKVMARALQIARQQISELQSRCFSLTMQTRRQEKMLQEMKPKADYLDSILHSPSLILTTQIAKDYGMSTIAFNLMLRDLGVQYRVREQWVLYEKYQGQGYTASTTFEVPQADGSLLVKQQTEWTQKGRRFLYLFLKENGRIPVVEQQLMEMTKER